MAMHHDNLPPGVDILFNTNKSDTGNKLDAMKPMKDDPTNPFGATVRQIAVPGQGTHIILPIDTLNEGELYAPNFRNGERVVLIRHPHGGKYEIPELTVNNNHPESKRLLGDAKDAIGIHHKVAEKLSGADFDADTVLVIPNPHG